MDFLLSFLRRHFAGKPLVTSQCRLFSQAGESRSRGPLLHFAEKGLIKSYVYVIELVQVCKMY